MVRWRIEFFRDEHGRRPVVDWLDALAPEVRGRVLARIDLLAEHGPTLDFPYTSQIEARLREIRLRFGKTRYRVLYFFDDSRTGILLHAFAKDTEAIESVDKQLGIARMNAHLERTQKPQKKKTKKGGK